MGTIQITQEDIERIAGERYSIEELAGNGGFGDVYRGYDRRMNRPVAVKVVRSLGDREAEVLLKIEHSGLPRLYDVIHGEEVTVMVMEWIAGVDLEKYINGGGTISEKTAVRIGIQLLEILDYLHTHTPAIVYQDLKPSNIMLMPDGHIKLVDFGTALVRDYGDRDVILAGTVGYGAPEQRGITGVRHASAASDLYAWGAVMYTLLSGILLNKPPYTMKKIRTVCPGISYGLSRVISVCTRRNEKDRYSDAKSVIRALSHRNIVNVICKCVFTVLFCACVIPFVLIWFSMYKDGQFMIMSRQLHTANWLLYTGEKIRAGNILRSAGYIIKSDSLLRNFGYMLLTGAWMFVGLKFLQNRRFIKIKKSIYLSSRRYPGLWIPTLVAGIIFGCGLGGNFTTVSQAKEADAQIKETDGMEKETDGEVDITRNKADVLPVSFVDVNGNNMLLRFDAPYDISEDMTVKIDSEYLADYGDGEIRISVSSGDGLRNAERIIPLTNCCEN